MAKHKFIYIQIFFILVLFFWEIGSGFSDRGTASQETFDFTETVPVHLDNTLSSFQGTEQMEQTIASFLNHWKIKGASVAVSKDGRLVYARGFGYANEETYERVEPMHLFRIASVSKLVTAVAIMHLEEEGFIDLDAPVFGKQGILNDSKYLSYTDERYEQITVHHLLTHRSGWSGRNGDPMFMPHMIAYKMKAPLPVANDVIIQYMMKRRLNDDPGSKYSYSNLGYVILGEIIQKVTGIAYEDYVKLAILQPLGIRDMHIGHGFYEEKAANEVTYYNNVSTREILSFDSNDKYVPAMYGGNNLESLGAAGGWIASPSEFMLLLSSIDGDDSRPDILKPETIKKMTTSGSRGYDMIGWKGSDGYGTWWRTGTLTGSSALIVRQNNGISWMIITNTTTSNRSRIHSYTSRTMFRAIASVKAWPGYDLFDYQNLLSETPVNLPGRIN